MRTATAGWIRSISIITSAAVFGVAWMPVAAAEPTDDSLAKLVAAWEAREKACQRIQIRWSQAHFQSAEMIDTLHELISSKFASAGGPMPPHIPDDIRREGKTSTETKLLDLDGDLMRLEGDVVEWSVELARFIDRHATDTWNGTDSKYASEKAADRSYNAVGVSSRAPGSALESIDSSHFVYWCRPFNSLYGGLKPSDLKIVRELPSDAAPLLVVQHPTATGGRIEFEVDPNRSYVIQRISVYHQDKLGSQSTIVYVHDAQHGWIPSRWGAALFRDGQIFESIKGRVEEFVVNGAPPREGFDIVPKPGSWVQDAIQNNSYIVLPSGRTRVVRDFEAGQTYEVEGEQ